MIRHPEPGKEGDPCPLCGYWVTEKVGSRWRSLQCYSCGWHNDIGPLTPGDIWEAGYKRGKAAKVGDHLPHPSNWSDPEMFWYAMRAALRPRGLDVSMFLVVIPLDAGSTSVV